MIAHFVIFIGSIAGFIGFVAGFCFISMTTRWIKRKRKKANQKDCDAMLFELQKRPLNDLFWVLQELGILTNDNSHFNIVQKSTQFSPDAMATAVGSWLHQMLKKIDEPDNTEDNITKSFKEIASQIVECYSFIERKMFMDSIRKRHSDVFNSLQLALSRCMEQGQISETSRRNEEASDKVIQQGLIACGVSSKASWPPACPGEPLTPSPSFADKETS